jgi:hypothetical protein
LDEIWARARLGADDGAGEVSACCIGAGEVEEEEESDGVGDGEAGRFRIGRLRLGRLRVGSAVLPPVSALVWISSACATATEFQPKTVSFRGAMFARDTNPDDESRENDEPESELSDGDTGDGIRNELGKPMNCSGNANWGAHAGLGAHEEA